MRKYLIIALALFFITSAVFLPRDFRTKEESVFQITKGEGLGEIAANLQNKDFIWSRPLFQLYVLATWQGSKLQAGCYFLSPSMSIPEIASILSSGAVAKEKITIPEGFTSEQIIQKLRNVTRTVLDTLSGYEGYLFPDTYEIPYCADREAIAEIMRGNFDLKTAGLKITPEVVVMASILEKEVKTKEEKELAAGVLWKRLKAGIPLQVDAHDWTYKNYGLPPKPISNPGIESILAAMNPKNSEYWYYLSTPEGKTIFTRTLEEHNIAKARYLK